MSDIKRVAVIDYGMGNLHSVASALKHVSPAVDVQITSDHAIVQASDHVIFPGVGAIRDCMAEIRRLGFDSLVLEEIASGKPVLAICIGMQALLKRSDENEGVACLGYFDGEVKNFSSDAHFQSVNAESAVNAESTLKVPHMGWNQVRQCGEHPLWQGIDDNTRFYFVHSYFAHCTDTRIKAGETHYGLAFTSALANDNVFATQFHPEKSHDAGLSLLKNFLHWDGR